MHNEIHEALKSKRYKPQTKHLKRRSQRPYRPPEGVSWYNHVHDKLGLVAL